MPAHWETGVVVRKPTWHRLERAVLPDYITDWATGLKEAGIDWEVYKTPAFDKVFYDIGGGEKAHSYEEIPGWYQVKRDDSHETLAIQPSTYALIPIKEFGDVVETVAGDGLKYEAIFSLYEGKMIVALLYFDEPLNIDADDGITRTLQYLCMQQRFDGQGGLRGLPTSVRTICANTVNNAEALDGKALGFNIKHTANWEERVEAAAMMIQTARRDAKIWTLLANKLSTHRVGKTARESYLRKLLPISEDMTERQIATVEKGRDAIRELLTSRTNEHIADNAYGLLCASIEWADHGRRANTDSSMVARQFRKEPIKARAARLTAGMAGVLRKELLAEVED